MTDVASAYYRTVVGRALGKMRYAEWDRRKREKSTVTTYLRGQRRWHPEEDKWNTRMFWLPKNAWTPVAPPVIEDEESRHLKAVEAVTSACWTDLDRRIMALKEEGDLSDTEIGELVDKTSAQVNRAWHGVLERSEATLGLDGDNEKYRKCHRRKHRRDTLARWSPRKPFSGPLRGSASTAIVARTIRCRTPLVCSTRTASNSAPSRVLMAVAWRRRPGRCQPASAHPAAGALPTRYLAAGPFLRAVQRLYRLHALAFIASTTADGFRWRMYLSVVATDECPNWH